MVFWNSGRFVLPIILLGLLEFYHYPITLFVMYCELCNIECVKVFPGFHSVGPHSFKPRSLEPYPLSRIPLGRIPLGRIPLGRIPSGRIPLGRIPISRCPLKPRSL